MSVLLTIFSLYFPGPGRLGHNFFTFEARDPIFLPKRRTFDVKKGEHLISR